MEKMMQSPALELNLDDPESSIGRPSRQKYTPIRFSEEKFIEPYQRKPKLSTNGEIKEQIRKALILSEERRQIKPPWLASIEIGLLQAGCMFTGLTTENPLVITKSTDKIFTSWEDLVRYDKLFPIFKDIYSTDRKHWPPLLLKFYDFYEANFLFFELENSNFQDLIARYFYSTDDFSNAIKKGIAQEITKDQKFDLDLFLKHWVQYPRNVSKLVYFLSILFSRLPKEVKLKIRKFYPGIPESKIWKVHRRFKEVMNQCDSRFIIVAAYHGNDSLRFDIIKNSIRISIKQAIRSAVLDLILMKLDHTSLLADELIALEKRRAFLRLPSITLPNKNVNCLKKYGVRRGNKPINMFHLKKHNLYLNEDSHFDTDETDSIQCILSHFEFC